MPSAVKVRELAADTAKRYPEGYAVELRTEALQAGIDHCFTLTIDGRLGFAPDPAGPAVVPVRSVQCDPERITVKVQGRGCRMTLATRDLMVRYVEGVISEGSPVRMARSLNAALFLAAYEREREAAPPG
jgi:hypothetical protein